MKIYDNIENGVLEQIFKNTADKITGEFFDPLWEKVDAGELDQHSEEFSNLEDEASKNCEIKWKELLEKHNIELQHQSVAYKFYKKNLREKINDYDGSDFHKIYNAHLRDSRICVICEVISSDYCLLFSKEIAEKIIVGYQFLHEFSLKKEPSESEVKDCERSEITFTEALLAGSYHTARKEIVIDPKSINVLKKMVEDLNYYTLYENYSEVEIISSLVAYQTIYETRGLEYQLDAIRNLHLFDFKINARQEYKRPDCGWVCVPYYSDYLLIPKDLAKKWLEENKICLAA